MNYAIRRSFQRKSNSCSMKERSLGTNDTSRQRCFPLSFVVDHDQQHYCYVRSAGEVAHKFVIVLGESYTLAIGMRWPGVDSGVAKPNVALT